MSTRATANIVLEGTNLNNHRLITIEIAPDTNLFKEDDMLLPLFNGWINASGDVLTADQRPYFKVKPQQRDETTKQYMSRLEEVALKIRALNQWHLTMRSRHADEDAKIMDQIRWLNDLPAEEYGRLMRLFFQSYYPDKNSTTLVTDALKCIYENPTQIGSDNLLYVGKLDTIQPLRDTAKDIPDGFGFTWNTYSYDHINLMINKQGEYLWSSMSASSEEDETESVDIDNPLFLDILDGLR